MQQTAEEYDSEVRKSETDKENRKQGSTTLELQNQLQWLHLKATSVCADYRETGL